MTPELALAVFAGFTILVNLVMAYIQLRSHQVDAQRTERSEREARYRQNFTDIREAATQFLTFLVAIEDVLPSTDIGKYISQGSVGLARMTSLGAVVSDDQLREEILEFVTVAENYQNSARKEATDRDEITATRNTLVRAYADIIARCDELSAHPTSHAPRL